ncbi:MAG: sulfite dehydrogenase [Burkholderiales bacterium RIFCSPLOWO2_02_FULL_57_36]|nr:MAG: sulfite dehydrogenase [Burkholderiales bacterium RIFCSPLOWO2_02_FULL_57_36]
MKKAALDFVAGGGLIERRSFLRSGLGFTVASMMGALPVAHAGAATPGVAAQPSSRPVTPLDHPIGAQLPAWMKTAGGADVAYGMPSPHEKLVVRKAKEDAPQNAGFAVWHTPIETQRGIVTPSGLHFSVHHNGIPDIDPQRHQLIIHGLVERPLRFDMERLLRYPMISNIQFLECSGNTAANAMSPFARDDSCQDLFGQVSCAEWTGIPLSTLLREAGVKSSAKWVIAEGADGGSHTRSLPLSKLMDDAIIAIYQNGERLRASQGYPMRLFVPGWEGNVNVKWLHRLEVTDGPAHTKDESGLYSEVLSNGDIERFTFHMDVKSVITHPSGNQVLPEAKGFYEISGLAWSGYGKIRKVEVSADNGKTWAGARLHGPVLDKALTRFSIPWRWDGSSTTLLSRATDEHGRTQLNRNQWKRKYAMHSFNHYNAVQAWKINRNGKVENTYA